MEHYQKMEDALRAALELTEDDENGASCVVCYLPCAQGYDVTAARIGLLVPEDVYKNGAWVEVKAWDSEALAEYDEDDAPEDREAERENARANLMDELVAQYKDEMEKKIADMAVPSYSHIAVARSFRGLTQSQLAERAGFSRQQMTNWESGFRTPNRANAEALASALDVDLAWVMGCPQALAVRDFRLGKDIPCCIVRTEAIEGYGTLYHVYSAGAKGVFAVILADGVQMTTTDWQNPGAQPSTAVEIVDCNWMDARGCDCVMLSGLPRVGWWSDAGTAPSDQRHA